MYNKNESELSFYDEFRTYRITKGDTLESVAQKLNIDPRELRRYHNIYCLERDLIERDFKSYSKFLILAPEEIVLSKNEKVEKNPVKVELGENNKLPFLPRGIYKDYSVEYIFETGNKKDTMEMGVRINWLATDEKNYNLFEINRSINLFIDDDAPDIIMDEINSKIGAIVYPLKIVVDPSGKWIDIYNYEEIVSRWKDKKNQIFDDYKEDTLISQRIIEFTKGALTSSETLFTSLSSDYFLRSFFNGLYRAYTAEYVFDDEVSFPLEKNKESVFKIQQKMNPYLNEDGLIEVEQKGDYLNAVSETDFNEILWDGSYTAKYKLNSSSYFIEKMNLECSIEYDEPIKIKLIVESLKKEKTKQ